MLQIGDQFDRFQIRSHMAQGGMADIYRAHDMTTGREVVLKIPNHMLLGDPGQYERFQRELEVTNLLDHPAIQKGLGSGQYNRTPYLVTEFVQGESMRTLVERETPMASDKAIALIRKIADGVAYCHEHDVIHRDMKPENIMITADGQPIILDFGLALTKGARRVTYANLTPTAGTPDYMAPEQIEGQRGDQRTDVYALGIILHELLTGRLPFAADNYQASMARHLQGIVPRLDREVPSIPSATAAIVARCLQRNSENRYPSMRALIRDLDHLESVDLSILETGTGTLAKLPIWKNEIVRALLITGGVLAALVAFGFLAQGFGR
jgi:serine/threonine-protein kinase